MNKKQGGCFTFVVEAVGYFVSYNHADSAVIQGLREMLAVEERLEDSSGKHWKSKFYLFGGRAAENIPISWWYVIRGVEG